MHDREEKIIEILRRERRYVTASELATKLSVSPKTIYRDIHDISKKNSSEFRIRKKENSGYCLVAVRESKWNGGEQFEHLEERRLNLLLFLLSITPCKTSILKISERYYISQSSIMNDFKHIESIIKPYGLHLSRENDGTCLKGNQLAVYRVMSVIIESYLKQSGDPFSQYDIPDSVKDIKVVNSSLSKIKELLHEIQVDHDLVLDQPYYLTLYCSLLSIIEKRTNNLQLLMKDERIYEEMDAESAIYQITMDMADKLEAAYSITLRKSEIYHLYYILKAYKLNCRYLIDPNTEKADKKVERLAQQLISTATENSGYQFVEDEDLKQRLTLHLHSMVYRLNHQIYIINPLLKSIRQNFSSIFNLVKRSAEKLTEDRIYDKQLTDEEIGYITLYFQISYDERFANKIPVLIECTSGIGTSHLLSGKIKKNFPNILVKRIISQQRINQSDYDDVELVISTVKTKSIIDKPTILVSPILNDEDKYKIDQFIKNYYKKQMILPQT
ncbi:Transcriptional antiterminator [Terribacillus halophilus]|uniref:Transcriptional antiterminator n=1 Tax=Terribacillus halophilus TaxID=361279 RepID=A0A1G6LJM5_9BACI|nr:PRD domain-containing protein [Terribacillus halophilus]SDC42955.1 Transcriptional antiterminator [Terribacillus halophilus]